MDWFTSDWHLGHSKTLEFAKRPYKTVEEMNEGIINNALSVLKKGDNLFHLGDISFTHELAEEFLKTISKRRIHFFWILGNHDIGKIKVEELRQYCHEITFQKVIKREKTKIHLSHFPQMCWDNSFRNSFHLYGHVHVSSPELEELEKRMYGKSLNVNLEFHDMKMWNLHEIFDYMEKRPNNWDYDLFVKAKGVENEVD